MIIYLLTGPSGNAEYPIKLYDATADRKAGVCPMTTPDTSIASRSLDIHVAKLMGYTIELRPDSVLGDVWRLIRPDGTTASVPGLLSDEERGWNYVPYFSSDRSAAFELLSMFDIWIVETTYFPFGEGDSYIRQTVVTITTQEREVGEFGKPEDFSVTACRAVIAAKGLSL